MAIDLEEREAAPPWQRAAGIALPLVAVAVLCAIKPEIVRGTFSSATSVLRVAALLVAWVLFSWLTRRIIPNPLVRTAVIAVPALALLWWNVAPYFREDVTITGSFPESVTVPTTEATTPPTSPAGTAPAATVPATVATTVPASPVQVTTGRFRGLDGHRGSGEAAIFRQPDGSHVVAFRNLSVSSVPDPVLYLAQGADRENTSGAVRLGRFDDSQDRYVIPAGTNLDGPLTVLIWCQRFAVPVAGATQQAV